VPTGAGLRPPVRKTLLVGLIIPRITAPFFSEVVQGVESVARRHGYSVFLCHIDEDP
jgi:LacI family transcriptional regulator